VTESNKLALARANDLFRKPEQEPEAEPTGRRKRRIVRGATTRPTPIIEGVTTAAAVAEVAAVDAEVVPRRSLTAQLGPRRVRAEPVEAPTPTVRPAKKRAAARAPGPPPAPVTAGVAWEVRVRCSDGRALPVVVVADNVAEAAQRTLSGAHAWAGRLGGAKSWRLEAVQRLPTLLGG